MCVPGYLILFMKMGVPFLEGATILFHSVLIIAMMLIGYWISVTSRHQTYQSTFFSRFWLLMFIYFVPFHSQLLQAMILCLLKFTVLGIRCASMLKGWTSECLSGIVDNTSVWPLVKLVFTHVLKKLFFYFLICTIMYSCFALKFLKLDFFSGKNSNEGHGCMQISYTYYSVLNQTHTVKYCTLYGNLDSLHELLCSILKTS